MTAIYAAVEFIRHHSDAAEFTRIRGVRVKIVHVRHTARRPWNEEQPIRQSSS
jgi:hypothetical protein